MNKYIIRSFHLNNYTKDYLLQEMQIVLELYSQLDSKVAETEISIKECVFTMNPPMLSIPGIGVKSAAVCLRNLVTSLN